MSSKKLIGKIKILGIGMKYGGDKDIKLLYVYNC